MPIDPPTNPSSAETVFNVDQEQLARTYAKAFLGATSSMDQAALVEELDSLVADVLDKFPDFDFHMTSSVLSHEEREVLIDKVLGTRASEMVVNLLKTLSLHNRQFLVRPVIGSIHKLVGEMKGQHEVQVFVPQELSKELTDGLRQALQSRLGMAAEFHFHIKPELIGGMVVQVGDTVFDGSVRTTLERARRLMVESAIAAIESRPDKFTLEKEVKSK